MTIYQMSFLDELAKLLKAYNVSDMCAVMNNIIIRFDESGDDMQFSAYDHEIFRDVKTKTDYKPNETELNAE